MTVTLEQDKNLIELPSIFGRSGTTGAQGRQIKEVIGSNGVNSIMSSSRGDNNKVLINPVE